MKKKQKSPQASAPSRTVRDMCESAQIATLVQNSYVLSRFWAWFSRIQVSPTIRIPVPRLLTYRDP